MSTLLPVGRVILSISLLSLWGCGGGGSGGVAGPTVAALQTSGKVWLGDSDELLSAVQSSQGVSYAHSAVVKPISKELSDEIQRTFRIAEQESEVRVAIFDSGLDLEHPDLKENILKDSNDNVVGVDSFAEGNNPQEFGPRRTSGNRGISHGTHVAGIVAAVDNNIGVLGIAPKAKIIPVRWLSSGISKTNKFPSDDIDPSAEGLGDLATNVAKAAELLPFVINNSWTHVWRPTLEEIELSDGGKGYFLRPRGAGNYRSFIEKYVSSDVKHDAFTDPEFVLVFAAGNDGWNSETGEISVFKEKFTGQNFDNYRDKNKRTLIGYINPSDPRIRKTDTPANIPSSISAYFLANEDVKGKWLSVVATDRNNIIAPFSNGCGIAKGYCLAAPGTQILSTIHRDEVLRNKVVGYDFKSGTSMAAPFVSGALAALKSWFPTLTPESAVKLLLCTATDLDKTGGRPAKPVSECLATENSLEIPLSNGWAPSAVYGHGLVNIAAAIKPQSPRLIATPGSVSNGISIPLSEVPLANTRLSFSSAFGNAASRQTLRFGVFDMFNRSYSFTAPLSDKIMAAPTITDVLVQRSDHRSVVPITGALDNQMSLSWSQNPISSTGVGAQITYKTKQVHTKFGFASKHKIPPMLPRLAVAGNTGTYAQSLWAKIAPTVSDLARGDVVTKIGKTISAGLHFNAGRLGDPNSQTSAYGFHDYAGSLATETKNVTARLRVGRFVEDGHFLGSKAEGGYALARGSGSSYQHLAAKVVMGSWSVDANATHIRTNVDFEHNSFVDDTHLSASEYATSLTRHDLSRSGDALSLSLKLPMAVDRGRLVQHSVRGYTADGQYRVVRDELDMAVTNRHRAIQLDYTAQLVRDVSWFVSLASHRNWSNFAGKRNDLMFMGLTAQF